MSKVTFTNSNNPSITMSAVLNLPTGFDESKTYPAIVVTHPGGGVKEQTSGTYARLRTHNQKRTVAARAMAEAKTVGHLS